jgi:hypothetical protein
MREFDTPIERAVRRFERKILNGQLRDKFREVDKQARVAQQELESAPVISIIENEAKRTKPTEAEQRAKRILRHIRMLIRADVQQVQETRRLVMMSQLQRAKMELARRDPRYMRKLLLVEKLRRLEARQCR